MQIEIIKTYYPVINRYARRILCNKFAAEDIATHVLEQLWELPSLWQNTKQLRTHLQSATRIACNQWLLTQALQLSKQKSITNHCHPEHNEGQQPITSNQQPFNP